MIEQHPRVTDLALVAALAILASGRPAPAAEGSETAALRSEINGIVAPYVAARDFHGVVAVQREGKDPLILPYGQASVELAVPHQPEGIFLIGSISKQFTAAAILLLEEDGKLSTQDPVTRFLPGFADGDKITIEQLLTHTSGVEDIYSLARFGATAGQVGDFGEVIADLARIGATFPPGSRYSYSNGGYSVLAAILEKASGKSYGDFLAERIFAPLRMTDSSHSSAGPAIARRVPGYDPWGATGLSPALPLAPAFTAGSGSLWSSARDLLTWSAALHGGRVLAEDSYSKMTRVHTNGYGYGVSRFRRFGREVLGHDGRVAGYASDLARYLDDRVTVAILGNVQSVARDEIRRMVAAAVFGEDYTIPAGRAFLERPAGPLEELVGAYAFGPGFTVTITAAEGRLFARANQGGTSELMPMDEDRWFSRMLYANVRFGRDETGRVERLIWGDGEGAPAGIRKN